MNDIFNEMTLGLALLFAASVILAYSLMAKRMEGYGMFLSQYRRKRVGWMLWITPILHGMSRLLNRLLGVDNALVRGMRLRLRQAGVDTVLTAEEMVSLQFVIALGSGAIGAALLFVFRRAHARESDIGSGLLFVAILAMAAFFFPVLPLDNARSARRRQILSDWPFFLDLLTLAMESGMDMTIAIQRIVGNIPLSPLSEELMRLLNEIHLGARRVNAMKDMAARIGIEPISVTVDMMTQAEELGTELGPLLRIQAREFRERKAQYVEKLAMEAPVKMLLPLLGCIFPSILIMLIGPVMIQYYLNQ